METDRHISVWYRESLNPFCDRFGAESRVSSHVSGEDRSIVSVNASLFPLGGETLIFYANSGSQKQRKGIRKPALRSEKNFAGSGIVNIIVSHTLSDVRYSKLLYFLLSKAL